MDIGIDWRLLPCLARGVGQSSVSLAFTRKPKSARMMLPLGEWCSKIQ